MGAVSDYGYAKTKSGYAIVPSQDVKERIEDQLVPEAAWAMRNLIVPFVKGQTPPDPKKYPPPKGYDSWVWDFRNQEFRPDRKNAKPVGYSGFRY